MFGYLPLQPIPYLVGIGHEILEFVHVIGPDLEHPALPIGILIDQLGILLQLFVQLHHC